MNYFKGSINSKAKFHITTGHQTVMGKLNFFTLNGPVMNKIQVAQSSFDQTDENIPNFSLGTEYLYVEEFTKDIKSSLFILIELETPLLIHEGQTIVGSKLDTDVEANVCRIAFYGKILLGIEDSTSESLKEIKIVKWKERKGVVDRIIDANNVLVSQLFTKESNIQSFIGSKIFLPTIECYGTIKGTFGQSGKIKVQSDKALFEDSNKEEIEKKLIGSQAVLKIKKYLYRKSC